ncbi:BTAD domain-containing putative transcriptional regulator [Dactylosporangium sp. NPDC005572]|uniref:BTAD domain-containing putative transcriptional regulator n=1 Tax=Dactylosporangium sp. NPDC005572 TaxID=3156889 RepID=UPI0033ABD9D4
MRTDVVERPVNGTSPTPGPQRPGPAGLTFAVLGPVRAWRHGRELALGSPQQVAVLSALLLYEGRPVQPEVLIDVVWDGEPPRAALGTVRTYLSRLRRVLGEGAQSGAIVAAGSGYALPLRPDALDLAGFRGEVAAGQSRLRAGDPAGAVDTLRRALGRWHGDALAGVPGRYAAAQRSRLGELRLAALESRLTAELAGPGPDAGLAEELSALVEQYPLREGFRELLMLSLYRSGRRADALRTYLDGDRRLRDEVGVEPGPALRRLQQRMLAGDPALLVEAAPPVPAPAPTAAVAVHLPADLPSFVGRTQELAQVTERLAARTPGTVGIVGLDGTGRSTLLIRAARMVTGRYPGGVLHADLAAADEREVLRNWLHQLTAGADGPAELPASACGLAALLRPVAAGRRMLVLADNVADGGQVARLRDALPEADLLFTAHRRVTGAPGAAWVRLGPLSSVDGLEMLRRLAGPDRIDAEVSAARRLVDLCSAYPTPLRLVAERLEARPDYPVAVLAAELAEELDSASVPAHDDCVVAEAPLHRAYQRLAPLQAGVLRCVAGAGLPEFTAPHVAALLDIPQHQAWTALDALVDVGLVEEFGPRGRYRMPYFVEAFTRRLTAEAHHPSEPARRLDQLAAHRSRAAVPAGNRGAAAPTEPAVPRRASHVATVREGSATAIERAWSSGGSDAA